MNNHIFANTDFPARILAWYDHNARILPWRKPPGEFADAYHVWLSEIMLQQTTVVTVRPYYEKFLTNWPSVKDLAAAPLDEVLSAWAGLGYYARARNLHKCAKMVCEDFGGHFPDEEEILLMLPGVGAYTAAAIASIAFGKAAVVVDGNIERIVSRVFRLQEALPKARPALKELAATVSPKKRAGDFAQAMMDIGATICTPKKPKCPDCPVSSHCAAFAAEDPEAFPKKAPKKAKPTKRAVVLWIENDAGEILLQRREEKGLLGGMMEFPSSPWNEAETTPDDLLQLIDRFGIVRSGAFIPSMGLVKHTFTHFHLELTPSVIKLEPEEQVMANDIYWMKPDEFAKIALPTLMKKVAEKVLSPQAALPL